MAIGEFGVDLEETGSYRNSRPEEQVKPYLPLVHFSM